MIKKLKVPFTFYGYVTIETTQEDYDLGCQTLEEKAESELDKIELLGELEWGGYSWNSAEWIENE